MKLLSALATAALLTLAATAPALAQQATQHGAHAGHADHAGHDAPASQLVDGEVKKIDKEAGKLTLRHGEIKNLNMPPMTMVFRVKDPAMLDQVQVGGKVKFKAEKVNGAATVVELQKTQ
jgi:Cu/Ag efflux protein CusF